MSDKKQIGRILLRQKALTEEELESALSDDERLGGRLASRLTNSGKVSSTAALRALSEQYGVPGIDLEQVCLKLDDLDLLPREIAERHRIIPVLEREDRLFIAMVDPDDRKVIDELEFVTGKKVYQYVALETVLMRVIERAYTLKGRGEDFYVGPNCPDEVLERAGVNAEGRRVAESIPPSPMSMTEPGTNSGVVLEAGGDQLEPDAEQIAEDDFGDLSKELSVVTDLPESNLPRAGARVVLIVDDEQEIRHMLVHLFSKRGFHVLEADRGHLALRLVKERQPDLIVLDAMLPEVHGFEIARRIRHSARYGHIPIVMVSAVYRGWRYAEDLKESYGVDEFIEKPFKIADVLAAVERALARNNAAHESDLERTSEEAEAALNAGVAAYRAGSVDEAIQHLQRGLSIDPLAYRLHLHLGLLYGRQERIYEAIGQLETAVEINSRHFPAVKNLAILYQKAGFRNKAAETWQRALTVAPDENTRQSIKQRLLSLL